MWEREVKSFGYAIRGLKSAFRSEPHLRFHAVAAACAVACACWVDLPAAQWGVILCCIGLVFTAELANTAIEKLVDLVSPGFSEKAGAIKDVAAGAVLVSAVAAAATGCVILLPRALGKLEALLG